MTDDCKTTGNHVVGVSMPGYDGGKLIRLEDGKEYPKWRWDAYMDFERFSFCPCCGADVRGLKLISLDGLEVTGE